MTEPLSQRLQALRDQTDRDGPFIHCGRMLINEIKALEENAKSWDEFLKQVKVSEREGWGYRLSILTEVKATILENLKNETV